MLDVFRIAKPQNCDIQIFYGDGSNPAQRSKSTWLKPRGVSHVYMLLIGSGGSGNGTTGGGSGAVTVYYTSAQNIPDTLSIWVGVGTTYVSINNSGSPASTYIQAQSASGSTAGAASAAPALAAQGFYQSVAGQNGVASGIGASGTSFLNGGTTAASAASTLYGYQTSSGGVNGDGFFMMQPIIVGGGGTGSGRGGIGCGGGANSGPGGPGMVLIASW